MPSGAMSRPPDLVIAIQNLAVAPTVRRPPEDNFLSLSAIRPVFSPNWRILVIYLLDCGPVGLNRKIFP
jgi:hypothetical protein